MEWSKMGRFWCPCKKSIIFLNFSTKIIWMNWQRLEEENPTPWERERAVPSQVSAIILSHYGQIGWFSVWEALWKSCPCGCGGRWWSVQPTRCWSPDWSYCCRAHSGNKIEYEIFTKTDVNIQLQLYKPALYGSLQWVIGVLGPPTRYINEYRNIMQ